MGRDNRFALVIASIGVILSIVLMMMSGLRPPAFLMLLFILWVTAPFVLLIFAQYLFRRRQGLNTVLFRTPIVLTLSSLVVYTYVLIHPPASQPAFPYVILPPIQFAVVIILILPALLRR